MIWCGWVGDCYGWKVVVVVEFEWFDDLFCGGECGEWYYCFCCIVYMYVVKLFDWDVLFVVGLYDYMMYLVVVDEIICVVGVEYYG